MAKTDFNPSDDRYTRGIIRRKVKQLTRRAGFSEQDSEDLEQELLLRVLQSLQSFDPRKGHRNKFITAVIERYVANVLRNQQAEKRDHRRISSLNVMITMAVEGPTEFAQTIGDRELDARIGRRRRSEHDLAELVMDLPDVASTLPEPWQMLLKKLKTKSVSEIARETGVPRTTLNGWIRRIRQRFEDAGLREYL